MRLLGIGLLAMCTFGCHPKVDLATPNGDDAHAAFFAREFARAQPETVPTTTEGLAISAETRPGALATKARPLPPLPTSATTATTVTRERLKIIVGAGLPRFLQSVAVVPYLDVRSRFAGWEITDHGFRSANIRAGDVIQRVQGRSIERPKDALAIWRNLARAKRISVRGERNGVPFQLLINVVD